MIVLYVIIDCGAFYKLCGVNLDNNAGLVWSGLSVALYLPLSRVLSRDLFIHILSHHKSVYLKGSSSPLASSKDLFMNNSGSEPSALTLPSFKIIALEHTSRVISKS